MKVRILHLEDADDDAELVAEILAAEGLDATFLRVSDMAGYVAALDAGGLDLILSDQVVPGFDGGQALEIARERCPTVPFILVTGSLGEEYAVDMMQRGAADFVLKERLARLVPAIRRALREAEDRQERRQAEERLREHAELLDKARDAITASDLAGRLTYWNKGAERLYGWSAAEARGRLRSELLGTPADQDGPGEWTGERTRKDGTRRVVESRQSFIEDDEGRPRSLLAIDTDVTEHKRLEAQFLRTQRLESLGSLAGGIAHDLNNIISPILMATDVLRRRVADDRGRRMLDTIVESSHRAAELIKQILTFARGEAGERALIQPCQVVREIERIVRETFPRSIDLQANVPAESWAVVADATQLHQVLLNLCVNARDAMARGGVLSLTVEDVEIDARYLGLRQDARPGPYVTVSVGDTGHGIPPEHLGRIFEPFFTTKAEGVGTGLGLSTCATIVRSHQGFLTVYSEPGRGTTFRVYLPASPGDRTLPSTARGEPIRGEGERVLVVDDEASLREITRETLESYGYRVGTAAHGAEAIQILRGDPAAFDVVVTDLSMPVMGGEALIQALHDAGIEIPVIATSGLPDTLAEAAGILIKPYTTDALLLAIQRALHPGSGADAPPPARGRS